MRALALVDPDLAGFEVNVGDPMLQSSLTLTAVKNKQPQHQGVLDILGSIDDLIEPAELLGGQDTGQPTPLLLGSKFADLPHPLGDVPPALIVQPLLPDQAGDLGDELSLG